ncbi:MAG: hypothetical protein Q8K72_04810, partial [Acidimicrobiales bacterium]|nr:hypothetical protein [Acidimicrobiales bacterium]
KTACAHAKGAELLALVARNGAMHVYNGCRVCHANLEGGRFHPANNIDALCSRSGPTFASTPPSQVCGTFGTELHHWAPAAISGQESALWPTAHLCPGCHQEWHRRLQEYYAAPAATAFPAGGVSLHNMK